MWIRKHIDNAEGRRKLRFSKPLWGASLLAAAVLALGVNGTLSQFVASIENSNNHVTTSAFGLTESLVDPPGGGAPVVCNTAGAGQEVVCPTINKYGQQGQEATPVIPGEERNTTVRLANSVPAPPGQSGNLRLEAAACEDTANTALTPTGTGDLCGTIQVTITCGDTVIGPLTLTQLGQLSNIGATPTTPPVAGTPTVGTPADTANQGVYTIAGPIGPGGFVDCAFHTVFPGTPPLPADLENITTTQPLDWVFTSIP